MDANTETRPTGTLEAFLAGLQAGMVGVLWMLAWLGISATWQRRSFWTAENLLASAFYGDTAIRRGFAFSTLSGLALYLILYSLLAAAFAVVMRGNVPPGRTLLFGIVLGLGWYYLSFHLIWKATMPLVALLHAERPTVLGHLVYGTFVGRFSAYLPRVAPPAAPLPADAVPENEAANQQTD